MPGMTATSTLASQVWHYWIAVPLAAGGILAVLATIAGYIRKVQAPKYHRR
jgi:formate-dependent nitrite reductase membrane component NrfD